MAEPSPSAPPSAPPAAPPAGPPVPERLLTAASEIFAARGYAATTVREVIARAGTNLNAISYHFGGKEQLYAAVMRYQAELAERAHPRAPDRYAHPDPAVVLGRVVEDFITRLLDPASLLPRLYARELMDPSPAFAMADAGRAEHQALHDAVAALLGPGAGADAVARCARSVYAQCAYFMFVRHLLPQFELATFECDNSRDSLESQVKWDIVFAALADWRDTSAVRELLKTAFDAMHNSPRIAITRMLDLSGAVQRTPISTAKDLYGQLLAYFSFAVRNPTRVTI